MGISITDPIGQAYNRAMLMTFKPFNVGKWFTLGFVAWLATLGEAGSGFNYRGGGGGGPPAPTRVPATSSSQPSSAAANPFELARGWISLHWGATILIGLAVLLVAVAFGLLILWISSRGKFMFLRALATNQAEVVGPWKEYRPLGDSLFAFRAYLALAGFTILLISGGSALLIAWTDIQARTFGRPAIMAIIVGAILFIPATLLLGLVSWCTSTFITIIMYAGQMDVQAAWREFLHIVMPGNVGNLVLFLLMQIVLGIGIVIGRVLIGCVTCCIGFLPYLSTVICLPLIVFMRCYPVYFLQQFGPRYLIIHEEPPTPPGGFPVIGIPYPPTL